MSLASCPEGSGTQGENKGQVVGHQAVRQQPDGTAMHRLGHNSLEGGVIFRLVKEFISSVAAIEGVVNCSAGGKAAIDAERFLESQEA